MKTKTCTCGKEIILNESNYIGMQEGKKYDLELYNCGYCGTTLAKKNFKRVVNEKAYDIVNRRTPKQIYAFRQECLDKMRAHLEKLYPTKEAK